MLLALEINLALWGIIVFKEVEAAQHFERSSGREAIARVRWRPAYRDQPSNRGDACQDQPSPILRR